VRLGRVIRRAAPLILAAGAAAYARRQRALEGPYQPELSRPPVAPPPAPEPTPEAAAPPETEPAPEPDPAPKAEPAPEPEPELDVTTELQAISREAEPEVVEPSAEAGADVTAVVDDLLDAGPLRADEQIRDAEVVEDDEPEAARQPPVAAAPSASVRRLTDSDIAAKVVAAVSEHPSVAPGSIGVEVSRGTVYLRGEIERFETITEVGRSAAGVGGVRSVQNLLHLPGTPAPAPTEFR
jgi:hypothetical protein